METIIAAADFFAAKLSYETDPSDLAAIRAAGAGPVVIDTRSLAGWAQGRIPGRHPHPGGPSSPTAPRRCCRTGMRTSSCTAGGRAATAARKRRSPWYRLATVT